MANEGHLLKLIRSVEQGSQGTDENPDNPLSGAVHRLFEDGKPFPRIALCFLGELAPSLPRSAPLRWLGTFILSAEEQVIFFPGFAFPPIGIQRFKELPSQPLEEDQAFQVDRISLEEDRTRWHVTTPKSKDHLGGWHTYPLGDGRFLWFGMSVACEIELRELKAETIVTSYAPPSDSRRQSVVFNQARDGSEFPCVSLHPELQMRFQEDFPHFVFIVGPLGFPLYQGDELATVFPFPPFLSDPLPNTLSPLPISSYKVSLGSVVDIQIITMWLPGTLRKLFCFTGPTA